ATRPPARTGRMGLTAVQLSPCQAVRDTQCACRNGTFCSPDHPCEMCQKCRCPKDEVELAPCTPHSDRQCGPPTDTFSGSSSKWGVVGLLTLLVLLFIWICCHRRPPGELRVQGTPDTLTLAWGEGGSVWVWAAWEKRDLPEGSQHYFHLPGDGRDLSGNCLCSTMFSELFPSLSLVLRRSFDTFARDVPYKDWKRFGRALDLLENDIVLAEMNDKYSLEPFFQMLNTWQNRQGMDASVNTLLETLHQINLGGTAEDISSKLVQQGYFRYEVS
uniref:TR10B factor n=1 Tax=Athene cunicularia TaxID=194338 RepID=A0A663MDG1_ATHCN